MFHTFPFSLRHSITIRFYQPSHEKKKDAHLTFTLKVLAGSTNNVLGMDTTKFHICAASVCWYKNFIMARLFTLRVLITAKTNYIYTSTDFT